MVWLKEGKGVMRRSMIIIILLFLVLSVAYLRNTEKQILFHPDRRLEFSPKDVRLAFEDVFFSTQDKIQLHGWFIPADNARYTVLLCHGNAGNISHRLEKIRLFNRLGCNVFAFDYRGYGKSQGSPSEKGLYKDAQAAFTYVITRGISPSQIIGYGESLGGAVIVDLARAYPIRALILESTFSSASDMAKIIYPFIPALIRCIK
jgi:fermentation-respiration switch protein FrsA (DUF1100 family)